MGLSLEITNIKTTSADLVGTFTSTSVGARYLLLTINGKDWDTVVNEEGADAGNTCTFDYTIRGLEPGTTYKWAVTLAWGDLSNPTPTTTTASGSFATKAETSDITPWSWSAKNGNASAAQTANAYAILQGTVPADDFSHLVWNDLVDKVNEVLSAKGTSWDHEYASLADTKAEAGDTLSAERYNSIWYNVNSMKSTGMSAVEPEDALLGSYITTLTDTLNSIINNL